MKKLASLVVASAALALPAVASAESIKLDGRIVGDFSASVKMRTVLEDGKTAKVSGFRARNVLAHCKKQKSIRIQLTALQPIPVDDNGHFKVRLPDGEGGVLRIGGYAGPDGKNVRGTVKTNDFAQGNDTCRVSKQFFRARPV